MFAIQAAQPSLLLDHAVVSLPPSASRRMLAHPLDFFPLSDLKARRPSREETSPPTSGSSPPTHPSNDPGCSECTECTVLECISSLDSRFPHLCLFSAFKCWCGEKGPSAQSIFYPKLKDNHRFPPNNANAELHLRCLRLADLQGPLRSLDE